MYVKGRVNPVVLVQIPKCNEAKEMVLLKKEDRKDSIYFFGYFQRGFLVLPFSIYSAPFRLSMELKKLSMKLKKLSMETFTR